MTDWRSWDTVTIKEFAEKWSGETIFLGCKFITNDYHLPLWRKLWWGFLDWFRAD